MRDTTDGACCAPIRDSLDERIEAVYAEARHAVAQAMTLPAVRRERICAAKRRLMRGRGPSPSLIADAILRS